MVRGSTHFTPRRESLSGGARFNIFDPKRETPLSESERSISKERRYRICVHLRTVRAFLVNPRRSVLAREKSDGQTGWLWLPSRGILQLKLLLTLEPDRQAAQCAVESGDAQPTAERTISHSSFLQTGAGGERASLTAGTVGSAASAFALPLSDQVGARFKSPPRSPKRCKFRKVFGRVKSPSPVELMFASATLFLVPALMSVQQYRVIRAAVSDLTKQHQLLTELPRRC